MSMLLVLGVVLFGLAILILSQALGGAAETGGVTRSLAVLRAMTDAPKELTGELDKPFADRILEPLQQRALQIGRRLSGPRPASGSAASSSSRATRLAGPSTASCPAR